VRAALHTLATRDSGLTRRLRDVLALGDRGTLAVQFWTVAIIDLALVVGGAFLLLPLWGMEWQEVRDWFYRVLFDLQIGSVSLSFSDIASAIALFIALLIGTRFLQRVLEQRILPQTQLDIGVRNSLRAATGYVGIVVAALVAFTALGLDFTQLALIAGALSVGIGFGLQNIVNNFVSGLILLIERPLKVGDWVIVGDKQGFVKQINVRSTEIETFERSTVIMPNSDLIQQPVVNWTYKDKYGRIDIRVGVAYGSDTQKVREVLLGCARDHADVARYPEPNVLFRDFGNSSLDFELRVFVRDVSASYLRVSSDLRFAIDAAFRENGIQIPFPQQDLHIKDARPLAEALREQQERPPARLRRKPAAE
jgi:small-conductance mechanosensitive channel